jgi:hypothetical protein
MSKTPRNECKEIINGLAPLFRPYAVPPSLLHEALQEAAKRAGWRPPSAKSQAHQSNAARGAVAKRQQSVHFRRVLVAFQFKKLSRNLQSKYQSQGTADAIIGRLSAMKLGAQLSLSARTVKADLKAMRKNGNFGI